MKNLIAIALSLLCMQLSGELLAESHRVSEFYETEHIADGLYTFRYGGYRNIFLVTDAGVIATDPFNPEAAEVLRAEIAKITVQPVKYLAYSHSHWDHAAGAMIFKDAGAEIVAQENCLVNMKETPHQDVVWPDITFADTYAISLGDQSLELFYLGPSHDNCLSVMIVRPANIMFIVDIANPPTGWYMEWDTTLSDTYIFNLVPVLKAIEELAATEGVQQFVGGHLSLGVDQNGNAFAHPPVGPITAVSERREFWETINGEVRTKMDHGMLLQDVPDGVDRSSFADRIVGYDKDQMRILLRRVGAYVESGR